MKARKQIGPETLSLHPPSLIPHPFAKLALLLALSPLSACQAQLHDLEPPRSQAEITRTQARAFDTADRDRTLRAVIVALQDLGFVVDRANDADGSVRAVKLDDYLLNVTVTVRPQGTSRTLVRANVRYRSEEHTSELQSPTNLVCR